MANNEDGLKFRISTLEDLGYTFKKPEESVPTDRIDFSMENSLDIDEESGTITFILTPQFTTGKRDPKLIAELAFKVEFDVQGLGQFVDDDNEDLIELPDQLVVTLFSISYSTMRGVFYEKSRGTMAERLILPIIDPKIILQDKDEDS